DRLFVSQRDVPDNKYFNEKPTRSFLQYIGSDRAIVYLYPTKINWDQDVAVQHSPHSISVFQGRKPRSYRREDNAGETKYLPDSAQDYDATFEAGELYPILEIIEVIEPETEDPAPEETPFDTSFDSGETVKLFPTEFDLTRLVYIFFENGQLKVTQIGAPEEPRRNIRSKYRNLRIISVDDNKLMLYPARIIQDQEINLRHEDGEIFLWQGSDQLPIRNVNRPDIVKVIKPPRPEPKEVPQDLYVRNIFINKVVEINSIMNISLSKFNPKILVSVSFKNDTWVISQLNTPKETLTKASSSTKLQIIKPSTETIFLHTAFIDPSEVHLRYDNGKIYIWQGDSQPLVNIETDVVSVPELAKPKIEHKSKPVTDLLVQDTIELELPKAENVFLNSKKPKVTFNQTIKSGRTLIPESDVDMPSVVQVIEPSGGEDEKEEDEDDEETVVKDLNQSVSDKMTLTLFSNMYNPDKLVVVKHANHQIHVNQVDRVKDDGNKNPGYEDLHLSVPNKSSATFDPRKVDPSKMIIINYIKKKTHINTAVY
ncbi:GSCOCG00009067001-RA-CDS, partial [Cotesia congregata]